MSVIIKEIKKESHPSTRLIGKKYKNAPNWSEWWQNDWFSVLEKNERLHTNDDAYIGAVRIINGSPERWIGMFFPQNTNVPEGFDYIDIEPTDYAVFYLYGNEYSKDFYTMETHNMCLDKLKILDLNRYEDHWCFERYQCPRFTSPDENGNVILDYGISIK